MNNLPQLLPEEPLRVQAAKELQRRRAARRQLIHFTQYTFHTYKADPVHHQIGDALQAVVEDQCDRLIIVAPPQHGKSELTSVRLPAYWLGKRPDHPVILASYGADLARSKSRQARDIVEGTEYQALFGQQSAYDVPVETRQDSRAVHEWRLANHRGGMLAVGVGGPITGHGAMLGIIDDPFENWEQAQSATYRNRVWEWYRATFRTRIWEGGKIVIIMTRWHEDDLVGRLLQHQPGEWDILRLPALAETQAERDENNKRMGLSLGQPDPLDREPGEPLSPSRYSRPALLQLKHDVGSMAWIAEYQGSPRAPEGNRFKRSWFEIVGAAPRFARRVRYWDKGGTKDGGAYTAGVLLAHHEGITYVEDVVRGQWSAGEREATILQTAELDAMKYGPYGVSIYVEQEPGSGGKESAENTIQNLAGYVVERDLPSGDKDVRLQPFAVQAEAGNVRMVRGLWNEDYLDEMAAIPNGTYRDQADGSAGAFNKLTIGSAGAGASRKGKAKLA